MKKNITLTLLMGFLVATSFVEAQISPAISARLQFVLDSVCNKYKIKGTSAAVLIPGQGVWKGVNGMSHYGTPINSDMLMGMGSNTKTHISALLLKMQEQGLISLNDTIGKWIQGYPNINGKITIRQCLNHTSGVFDYFQNAAINDSIFGNPSKIWQPEEILLLALTPNFTPGTKFSYSNTNYIIAGIIIQKVLNKSPYKALNEIILFPNNLNNTYRYGDQGNTTKANPWSMSLTGTNMTDMTTEPFLDNLFSLASTAGSLITTAEDNVQFWHKLTSGQILSSNSWEEMTKMVYAGSSASHGLGIFRFSKYLNGRTIYSHGGTFFGYINENIVDTTSKVCISVMTNQDSISNYGLFSNVIGALHKVTLNLPVSIRIPSMSYSVSIYPIPAKDIINIEMGNIDSNTQIEIYDMKGQLLLSEKLIEKLSQINTEKLGEGIYYLKITDGAGTSIIVKKIQILR